MSETLNRKIMANTTNNNDVIPDGVIDNVGALNKLLGETATKLLELTKALGDNSKSMGFVSNNTKELRAEYEKSNKLYGEAVALQKEYQRVQNEIAKGKAKLAHMGSPEAKQAAELTEKVKRQTLATRQNARETTAQANSIEQLRAKVARLKTEWANYDRTLPDFDEKTRELKRLNDELKEAEASVGDHTRNVGNYGYGHR